MINIKEIQSKSIKNENIVSTIKKPKLPKI